MLGQIIVLYVALLVANVAFVGATFTVARQLDLHIIEMKLGLLTVFRRGRLRMGAVPLGASVRFPNVHENEGEYPEAQLFENKPRHVRTAIALAGPAGMLVAALVLRGTTGWHSFVRAFEQIVMGALAPSSRGAELVTGYLHLVTTEGAMTAIGALLAKFAAYNLFPLPIVAGGNAVIQLLSAPGKGCSEATWLTLQKVGLVILLALTLSWLWAIYTAVRLNPVASTG